MWEVDQGQSDVSQHPLNQNRDSCYLQCDQCSALSAYAPGFVMPVLGKSPERERGIHGIALCLLSPLTGFFV